MTDRTKLAITLLIISILGFAVMIWEFVTLAQ